jgi:hypothetical protein
MSKTQLELMEKEGELWHKRMAHASSSSLHKLPNVSTGVCALLVKNNLSNCQICAEAKMHKKSFTKDRERATRPGEVLHSDLIGPITPLTYQTHKKYVMCVIDDFSRFLQVFLLHSKTETVHYMESALHFIQSLYPNPGQFRELWTDQGLEFTNMLMTELLTKYGMVGEHSEPYCHEHSGLVERVNRTALYCMESKNNDGVNHQFDEQLVDTHSVDVFSFDFSSCFN